MESRKGAVVLAVFCALLAAAGIYFLVPVEKEEPVAPPPPVPAAKTAPAEQPKQAPQAQDTAKTPPLPRQAPVTGPTPPASQEQMEVSTKDDPRFVAAPVDEPAMPLDVKAGEKFGYLPLRNSSGFLFERPDADGKMIGGVVIPGLVLVTRGAVELFGCGEGGKTHESIVRIDCDILGLDTAFGLAGFRRGKLPGKLGVQDPDQGSRLVALVQWTTPQGKVVTYRSEDLVLSVRLRRPMPRVGWTYVGRWIESTEGTPDDPDKKSRILGAAQTRSLVTTFRDDKALLDCPLEDALDDTMFVANFMMLPEAGTPVTVIIRGVTAAEREEIARVEKEMTAK